MIQELLTLLAVGLALFFLIRKFYRLYLDELHACEGCAVMKMRQQVHRGGKKN